MNTYFRVTVLSLVGMMFVCFSNVVFSKQNIAVVVGEDILANDNSVLSSMIGKPQSVEQSRTRTRKTHEVEVNKDKDVVMVRNGTDALLLSFVFGENTEKVELNAESTAIALVLLHPSLLGTITDVQQALVPEIKSLASFNKLVNKVRSLVQQDSAPLDYWKHPALIIKVNDVVEELLSTVNFEVLLSSHLRKGTRAPNERVKRGDFVIDETAFEKGTLKITNPKAIYYSVYLDNNDVFGGEEEKNILEAKEGLATVDAKLFPPSLGLATTKESSFELATLNTNQLTDYKINLVQDFSNWNPNTPEGFATWFNMIKGLNLVLKTVGKSVTPKSKDDFDNWVKTYLPKIQKMQDFLNSKTFVNARLYAHGGVMFVGILYTHTYDPELKKTLGEWYHLLKNTLAFVEKSAELLKLAPLKPNEVEKQIDLWVKEIFHQYETYSDFLPALKKGDVFIEDISVIYEKIVVEIQKKISSGILSSDFPFTYEYGMKKIMGIFDAMETTELLMPLLQLVLNDFAKDSVKVIGELIFKSVFGAYYKVASLALVIGNEVVPYMYDMFDAPKKVSFTVHEGVLKTLPSPELSDLMISLQADGTVLYHYDNDSGVVYSDSKEEFVAQRGIEMEQGSCIDLEYEALMAGNFTRGVEAITEGEIDPDENQAVIHFLSRIFVPDSSSSHINGNYIAHILKIWDKKGFSFNKPDWKYIFLDTQSGILEGEDLDQDDAKWPSEISLSTGHSFKHHFGNDDSKDAITVSDSFCLPQDYVPSFLRIELRNFQSESEDLFHVKLRKPNQPPVLEEPYVEKDPNDFLKYRFYVSAMDDYTPSENLNVKVYIAYDTGTKEEVNTGKPWFIDYQYAKEGAYEVMFVATDDEGLSDSRRINVYPGSPFTDLNPSEWYTKPILVLLQNGVIEGFDDGTFRPHQEVTRAEFLKMALLASPSHKDNDFQQTETSFSDVLEEHWASGYIQYATDEKIVTGFFTNGEFRPDIGISRVAAAKIIAETFKLMDTLSHFNPLCPAQFTYVSHLQWYCKYIRELSNLNILRGHPDNTFKPSQKMTRAETAATVCRAYSHNQTGDTRLCDEEN